MTGRDTGPCEMREALGGYLLGALDAEEAARVAEHLAECPRCRAEYDELSELPGLLGTVTPDEAERGVAEPSETGLHRLLARVRRQRRGDRRRRRIGLVAAAAALVVAVSGGTWGVATSLENARNDQVEAGDEPAGEPTRPTSPSEPSNAGSPGYEPSGGEKWSGAGRPGGPDADVTADVRLNPVAWGTKLDVSLTGVAKDEICSLVVVDADGTKWEAGSWKAAYGDIQRWSGGVALATGEIDRIVVYAHGYRPVVTLGGK